MMLDARLRGQAADLTQAIEVMARAVEWSGFSAEQLQGPSRKAPLVWARHLAIAAIRRSTYLSLSQIGTLLGDRDHTTILHAIRQAEGAARARPEVEWRLQQLTGRTLGE